MTNLTDAEVRLMTQRFVELNTHASFNAASAFLEDVAKRHPEAPFLIRNDLDPYFEGRRHSLVAVLKGSIDAYVTRILASS